MVVRGWVYLIVNKAMPGLVKIGFSTKDPKLRARELNNTGSPYPYEVVYDVLVCQPRKIEKHLHERFLDLREGKEWFRTSATEIINTIRELPECDILLETIHQESSTIETGGKGRHEKGYAVPLDMKCSISSCFQEASRDLGGQKYCIWHFRIAKNPAKADAIKLLMEEALRSQ